MDMASTLNKTRKRKRCFVTIGATAGFNSLVRGVLEPSFFQALKEAGYTELRIQHGDEGAQIFEDNGNSEYDDILEQYGIHVTGFDFNKSGLGAEMKAAKGGDDAEEGTVISHAGSGSILDALRIAVPVVVVPNTDLLHNHQVELAEVLVELDYVVYGKLE
jgi:beta-1,4-N-acetylglucosaminyltransferase